MFKIFNMNSYIKNFLPENYPTYLAYTISRFPFITHPPNSNAKTHLNAVYVIF